MGEATELPPSASLHTPLPILRPHATLHIAQTQNTLVSTPSIATSPSPPPPSVHVTNAQPLRCPYPTFLPPVTKPNTNREGQGGVTVRHSVCGRQRGPAKGRHTRQPQGAGRCAAAVRRQTRQALLPGALHLLQARAFHELPVCSACKFAVVRQNTNTHTQEASPAQAGMVQDSTGSGRGAAAVQAGVWRRRRA